MIYAVNDKRVEVDKGKGRIELFLVCTVNCVKIDSPNLRVVSTVMRAAHSQQGWRRKRTPKKETNRNYRSYKTTFYCSPGRNKPHRCHQFQPSSFLNFLINFPPQLSPQPLNRFRISQLVLAVLLILPSPANSLQDGISNTYLSVLEIKFALTHSV